jgi:hypothetical protein
VVQVLVDPFGVELATVMTGLMRSGEEFKQLNDTPVLTVGVGEGLLRWAGERVYATPLALCPNRGTEPLSSAAQRSGR